MRLLKWPLVVAIVVVLTESLFGHPALRLRWVGYGSHNPQNMSACECMTIFGERHYFSGYRSLVTMIKEPRVTVSGWVWQRITAFGAD